jgi:hypothetical protein
MFGRDCTAASEYAGIERDVVRRRGTICARALVGHELSITLCIYILRQEAKEISHLPPGDARLTLLDSISTEFLKATDFVLAHPGAGLLWSYLEAVMSHNLHSAGKLHQDPSGGVAMAAAVVARF